MQGQCCAQACTAWGQAIALQLWLACYGSKQAIARDAVQRPLRAWRHRWIWISHSVSPLHAACRFIERYNNKLRQAAKKDETRRMKAFVNNAYACDPRVLRKKAEEKAERCGRTHVVLAGAAVHLGALQGPARGCMTHLLCGAAEVL